MTRRQPLANGRKRRWVTGTLAIATMGLIATMQLGVNSCDPHPPSAKGQKNGPPHDAPAANQQRSRVAIKWQKVMISELENDSSVTVAAGMFSRGGWVDGGQSMVFFRGEAATLWSVSPGATKISQKRPLTNAEIKTLRPLISRATELQDIKATVFDGVVFEFVHLTRDGGAPTSKDRRYQLTKRLFIQADDNGATPSHRALIKAFADLQG